MGSLHPIKAKGRAVSLMLSKWGQPDQGHRQHRTLLCPRPLLPPTPARTSVWRGGGGYSEQQGHGSRLCQGLDPGLSPHTPVFQDGQSPLWALLLIQQLMARHRAGGGAPAPFWSQGQVLASSRTGWRALRKSLHLSKPQFPHPSVGCGEDSMS